MRRVPDNYLDLIARNLYTASPDGTVADVRDEDAERTVAGMLAEDVELYQPDVFALSEAASHADVIAEVAPLLGYRVLQEKPKRRQARGDDTGDCALLIAAHVTIRHSWTARMRKAWTVMRYRRKHQPHRYEVASIKVRGHRWRVRASHWPTGGATGGNREAWLESAERSKRWLSRGSVPSVDAGDLNEKLSYLAGYYGQRFNLYGKGIDLAITRGVKWATWAELPKGGSDHPGRHYRFVA